MRRLRLVVMMACLFAALPASASGLRGGGESVDVNSRPRLRDLVDKTVCRWISGPEFLRKAPALDSVLKATADTNWYFASALKREAERLNVCMTANLIRINTIDFDAVTVAWFKNRKQVAIRLNDMIFVDETILNRMTGEDRAMLVVHETMHSFIPLETERRSDKVRSMTLAVHDNYVKRMTKDEFALSMKMNSLVVINDSSAYASIRDDVDTLLDRGAPDTARLRALTQIEPGTMSALLWRGDSEEASRFIFTRYSAAYDAAKRNDLITLRDLLARGIRADYVFETVDGEEVTLLDLMASGNAEVVKMLLGSPSPEPKVCSSAAEKLLVRSMQGNLDAVEISRIMAMKPNPNALVDYSGKNGRTENSSLFTVAIVLNRLDVAELLLSSGQKLDSEIIGEALRLLVPVNSEVANTLASAIIGLAETDVNGVGIDGRSIFDFSFDSNNSRIADAVVMDSRFKFDFKDEGDVVKTHEKAKWLLNRFVALNVSFGAERLLSVHHFSWFDLYPMAETANRLGNKAVENVIRAKMENSK